MDVKKITVIGAGLMGNGIANVSALGGFQTTLNDISTEILDKAWESIKKDYRKGIERGKVTEVQLKTALQLLEVEVDFDKSVCDADLVIEAVPEKIDLKIEIFSRLDEVCREKTIFASNTSALSITEMAAATGRPKKVIGMHFFNPVHKMKLVEIVRGLETDDETYDSTQVVAKQMGKETVEIKESPGFITSRINAMIGNEAFHMLQEGIASAEDIDKAVKLGLNHPMGPFEMVDLVGLDTRLSVLKFLQQTLGEKYRPSPLLEQYVKAGRLGKKVGRGVYEYSEKQR